MYKIVKQYPILILKTIIYSPIIVFFIIINLFYKVRIGLIETGLFGHLLMHCELFLCERERGDYNNQKVIWITDKLICNNFILNKYRKHMTILPRFLLEPLHSLFSIFKIFHRYIYYVEQFEKKTGFVKRKGHRDDPDNLLYNYEKKIKFTNKEIEVADNFLEKNLGIKKNTNFVIFSSRNSIWAKKVYDEKVNSIRNSNINNQLMALEYLNTKGYKAIKIGKNHPKINFAKQNIVDFSNHKLRSDFLDMYLASKCKFMITDDSGISYISTVMRKKKLILNFFNWNWLYHQSLKFLPIIVPKKIKCLKSEKFITYKELLDNEVEFADTDKDLKIKGYIPIENNSLEIKNATINMLNLINNDFDLKNEKENQIEFWDIYEKHYKFNTDDLIICPSFFKENKKLFIN